MYELLLTTLKNQKLINNSKVSPWLERKISKELTAEIISATAFIEVDLSLANRIQTMLLNITEQPKCLTCNNPTNYFKEYKGFAKYCCKDCADKSQEKSLKLKKLYSEGKLSIGKQGVEIQREKYNGLLAIQADTSITEKIKKTCTEKYGVDNFFKTDIAKDIVRTNREKYKRDYERNLNISKEKLYEQYVTFEKTIDQCSNIFNCSPMYIWKKLYDYEIPINYNWTNSSHEKELISYLEDLKINFIANDRTLISPKEVDIYIKDYELAIEINGLWCHHDGNIKRGRNYHKNKYLECKQKNVNLIQFYDTEWIKKNEICKSMILSRLKLVKKIHARKCNIKVVDKMTTVHFLTDNHIQGAINSENCLGLYYNEELVSIMTFGKDRFNKNSNAIELYRFCSKIGISVIGGASKLFNHYINNNYYTKIISYCDIRLFNGTLYENLGFILSHISEPSYYYFNTKKYTLEHRMKYQLHKLPNLLENFNPDLTEYENMKLHKYFRIWDCGNKVYVYENKREE